MRNPQLDSDDNMELNIPKTFTLASCEYKVEEIEDIDDNGLGRTYSPLGLIKIAKTWQGKQIPQDSRVSTFYHELVHAILDMSEYKDLSRDEAFVQALTNLIVEYLKTVKYELEDKSDS